MLKINYNSGNRGTYNPLSPTGAPVSTTHQELVNEAVVVDVIVNDDHPEYANDGYNIGAIKFRSIKGDMFREETGLQWALPLDANITEYPLPNEIVLVSSILNRLYYTRKVNITSKVTTHAIQGLNEEMMPVVSQSQRSESYRKHTSERRDGGNKKDKLGKYFMDSSGVYRLRHDEGDVIFEGRSGQSIRFGASWLSGTNFQASKKNQSPNILLRTGPDPSQSPTVGQYGLVREDINKDASSIYLVSDQVVPIDYATKKSSVHGKSIDDLPNKLTGNQIVMNTDRFVMNTRTSKIMGFSNAGIHWTTSRDYTVDAGRNYKSHIENDQIFHIGNNSIFNVTKRISFVAPKIFVGTQSDESEPMVCGALLATFLKNFIEAISTAPLVLASGAPGTPSVLNPMIMNKLQLLLNDVAGTSPSFNSTVAYTTK